MKRLPLPQPHFLWLGAVCAAYFAGYNSRPRSTPLTAHELVARLEAEGLPLRLFYPGASDDPGLGLYLTTREDLPRFGGNVVLPFGNWSKWEGVVFAVRRGTGVAPPLPEAVAGDPHFLDTPSFRLAGDPQILNRVAAVLR